MTGTGKPRGRAFVTFEDSDAAELVIEALAGKDFEGRTLRVRRPLPKPP